MGFVLNGSEVLDERGHPALALALEFTP